MATPSRPDYWQIMIIYGILLQLLLLAIEQTSGCSVPQGWTSKSIPDRIRAAQVEIVVKARVIKKYPHEDIPEAGGKVYPARFDVSCVLKGPLVDERITVTGFGETGTPDCVTTKVQVGETYFVLMTPYEDRYRIVEYNSQPGVEKFIPRKHLKIESEYSCRDPIELPPTTAMPTTCSDTTEETTIDMTTESRGCKSCTVCSTILVAILLVQTLIKLSATVEV